MNLLLLNFETSDLLHQWRLPLWRLVYQVPQSSVGIIDLIPRDDVTAFIDPRVRDRVDWRCKNELDPQKINGKQARWFRQWMTNLQCKFVLYHELDIDTHLVYIIESIACEMAAQHIVLPSIADFDFLFEICSDNTTQCAGGTNGAS
jgi:hypothetical protein